MAVNKLIEMVNPVDTKGFESNNDSPKMKTRLEIVNIREINNGGSTQVCKY